jgi:aspartate/methionine/tyrosine aminotransferase
VTLTVTPSPVSILSTSVHHPAVHTPVGALGAGPKFPVSATLAANEVMTARRQRGEPVLPLAFGEAGLPVHPLLLDALASAAGRNWYGPVAGDHVLREAAAGYWARRGLPTDPDAVVCGPGSKALLFALVTAIGGDVAACRPSWVSYAAQASLAGVNAALVPGSAGVPDAVALARAVMAARSHQRRIRAVIVTLPDNPTGLLAPPAAVRALCQVAEQHDLVIISDEIYRDLVHADKPKFETPNTFSAERTVVTTGLSKNLALGGWRIGVARLPAGPLGHELRARLLAIGSEIWSAAANPVQHAAAVAFGEPPELVAHVARSRRLHGAVARAVAARLAAAGLSVPAPAGGFYVYPDFAPMADLLLERHGVTSDEDLAGLLLRRYGVGVLPASAFGEDDWRLRLRVATALLYGETDAQRSAALAAEQPCALPWIAASLTRLDEVLTDLLT